MHAGVVCWQLTLCDPHLSALEVRFSRRCAIQIDVGSVMEVHHPVFYISLGHMQNSMRSSVTLKLKLTLTLTLTLTDTGGAVLTLLLGYRPGGELP